MITLSHKFLAGSYTYCKDENDGCNVSEIISIKMLSGTCGQIVDSKTETFRLIKKDIPNTDFYFYGNLSSCPTHLTPAECPKGTFVKKIEWDTSYNLTKGIKLSCYKPESSSSSEALVSSHPDASFSESESISCNSFVEVTITRNMSMDADVALKEVDIFCSPINKTRMDDTLECEPFTALSGMKFSIETESKLLIDTKYLIFDFNFSTILPIVIMFENSE